MFNLLRHFLSLINYIYIDLNFTDLSIFIKIFLFFFDRVLRQTLAEMVIWSVKAYAWQEVDSFLLPIKTLFEIK